MKIIDAKQGSVEWLACRLGKLTASDAQCISTNGKGLETLCFEKAAELMTWRPKENYTNDDIERGHELEMSARNMYEIETGNMVTEVGFCEYSDYAGCSPDGMVGEDGLIEIKCPNDTTFVRYLYDKKVDPKYYAQMQMQLFITERQWVDYVVYNPNFENSLVIKRIERDEDEIKQIAEGLTKGEARIKEIIKNI